MINVDDRWVIRYIRHENYCRHTVTITDYLVVIDKCWRSNGWIRFCHRTVPTVPSLFCGDWRCLHDAPDVFSLSIGDPEYAVDTKFYRVTKTDSHFVYRTSTDVRGKLLMVSRGQTFWLIIVVGDLVACCDIMKYSQHIDEVSSRRSHSTSECRSQHCSDVFKVYMTVLFAERWEELTGYLERNENIRANTRRLEFSYSISEQVFNSRAMSLLSNVDLHVIPVA